MSELKARTADPIVEVAPTETQVALLTDLKNQLISEGEKISPLWFSRFNDRRLIEGLTAAELRTGIPLKEYLRHSARFDGLRRDSIVEGRAEIPTGPDNIHHAGQLRRHEDGPVISLDKVKEQGVDPSKVLYYRATQPSYVPKPEYYWTSDSVEVRYGLSREISAEKSATVIILVSTLEQISSNGGLIGDINDDQGIAVRQIGLGPFDQAEALTTFSRDLE